VAQDGLSELALTRVGASPDALRDEDALALTARSERFALFELIAQPVWVFDIDARRVHWANATALTLWSATSLQELCARDMSLDMSESVARRLAQYQSDFTDHDVVFNDQWTLYPGGVPLSLYVRFSGLGLSDGRMAMLCQARPTTSETPESLRSVEALMHTPVMITLYDLRGVPIYRNPASRASAHTLGQTLQERIVDAATFARMIEALAVDHLTTFTLEVHTNEGERWHDLSARHCRDAVTGEDAWLVSEADVSALKRTEAKANFLATHDELTGLPNRAHVIQRFTGAMEEIRRAGSEAALIFIDLDNFKDVNDTLGHAAGDELLKQVAERLRKATRSNDLVARLGGDEFLLLVSSQDIASEVDRVRERIARTISQPTVLRGTEVRVTPSLGVSLSPRDGEDLETLLRKADLAMYAAKARGRNDMAFYDEMMGDAVTARTMLEGDLRRAFDRDEFEVHYQPLFHTKECRIVAVEALVRWRHPERGLLLPDAFIPLCESTGMILLLGRIVFERAVQQQVAWARLGHPLKVHVNLSPRQFSEVDLVANMKQAIDAAGCDPKHIGIEITESILLGKSERSESVLRAIAAMNISIALDDFGTGYSNLAYLQRFPIDTLKIDKTFIQGESDQKPLADLIVALCRTLRMEVVAEGVETQAQLDWVIACGIERYQGFFSAKPMLPEGVQALLLR